MNSRGRNKKCQEVCSQVSPRHTPSIFVVAWTTVGEEAIRPRQSLRHSETLYLQSSKHSVYTRLSKLSPDDQFKLFTYLPVHSVNTSSKLVSSSFTMPNPWQDRLEERCREYHFQSPRYQEVSDRRGGRTAWSSIVTFGNVQNQRIVPARFWYNGSNVNNAREDAAENALKILPPFAVSQGRHGNGGQW